MDAIVDRRERISALWSVIAAGKRLHIVDERYELAAKRLILEAEYELRRLKGATRRR